MHKTKTHCTKCGRPAISEYERKRFKSMPTKWFTGLDKWELKAYYTGLLTEIREIAQKCGYAIGVHGSMQRDLDLIAIPWTDKAIKFEKLARRIHKVVCGAEYKVYSWDFKPKGRVATSMFVGSVSYLDLSVATYEPKK